MKKSKNCISNPDSAGDETTNIKELKIKNDNRLNFDDHIQESFENSGIGMALVDANGMIISINKSVCQLLGYTEDEFIGNNFSDFTHPEDIDKSVNNLRKLKDHSSPISFEKRYLAKNGNTKWGYVTISPIFNENGDFEYSIALLYDVTEQKKSENELKNLRDFHGQILNNINDGIWVTDKNDAIIYANSGMEQIAGVSVDQITGLSVLKDFPPETIEHFIKHYLKAKDTLVPQEYEAEVVTPSGRFTVQSGWLIPRISDGQYNGIICTIQDITEKNNLEKTMLKYFEMSSELICQANINTATFTMVSPGFTKALGYSEEELLSKSFLDLIHPDDKDKTLQVVNEQLQRGEKVLSFTNRYRCKDGSYITLDWNSHPVPEEGLTYAVARDVTKQKESENKVLESENKFRTLVDQAPEALFLHDMDGNIVDVNRICLERYGYSRDELLTMKTQDIDPDFVPREDDGKFWEKLKDKQPLTFEGRHRRKDGSIFPVKISLSAVFVGGEQHILALAEDITERKLAENEISQLNATLEAAQDMAKIGYWSYDIAYQQPTWSKQVFIACGVDEKDGAPNYEEHKNIVHPDDWPKFNKAVNDCISGKPYNLIIRFIWPDNSVHYVNTQGFPRYDSNGNMYELYGTSQDVTEYTTILNQLRQSEASLKTLIQTIPDMIWLKDVDGVYLSCNPRFEAFFGASEDEIRGKTDL